MRFSSSNSSSSGDDSSAAAVMVSFLRAYGLQPTDIDKLLQECPQLFLESSSSSSSTAGRRGHHCTVQQTDTLTASQEAAAAAADDTAAAGPVSSVYEVGRTLLFFHSLGWSHASVLRRIIALYPQV